MNIKFKHEHKNGIPLNTGTDGLYSQQLFRELLIHERKRSERSNRRFFLVTLDIKEVLATSPDSAIVNNIIKAIASSSRQADIKGWYEAPVRIGIIYTEITEEVPQKIFDKIKQALVNAIPDDLASRIVITCLIFPEEDGKKWVPDDRDAMLYPLQSPANPLKRTQRVLKRLLDVAASSAGIVALSPLMLTVALLIKMTSKGPVLYRQERVGLRGKKFMLYKFRSMKMNNNPAIHQEFVKKFIAGQVDAVKTGEQATYKILNDPRVTGIGRFIRKTSIDELPQLFNVLAGSMSLVGPRPPLAYEVEAYALWHRSRFVEAMPGITGLWQVYGRSRTTFDGMVRMDLDYIHSWSLWLDIKLLLKTPAAVFVGNGAC